MKHEKIFKRSDKSQIKIEITFYADNFSCDEYGIEIYHREFRKKTWKPIINYNNHFYRSLSIKDRKNFKLREYLKKVSSDEILDTMNELWQMLKPEKYYNEMVDDMKEYR